MKTYAFTTSIDRLKYFIKKIKKSELRATVIKDLFDDLFYIEVYYHKKNDLKEII